MINYLALPEWRPGHTPETPVDLAAVQADDDLLDTLGGAGPVDSDGLACVLASWRREVDADPIGEVVDSGASVAEWLRGEVVVPAWLAWVMWSFAALLPVFAAVAVAFWLIGGGL